MQASLHAMQIQQQPMRERPQAHSLNKKPTHSKRLEPLNINAVNAQADPEGARSKMMSPAARGAQKPAASAKGPTALASPSNND